MYHLENGIKQLPSWIGYVYQRHQFIRAVRSAYRIWMGRFPRWVNAGFDEYFLLNDAMPLLLTMITDVQSCDPAQLARVWASLYSTSQARAERAVIECTPVAANFIALLQVEYTARQNHLQPVSATALHN